MEKIVRLTENDLKRIVRQIIKEEECLETPEWLENFIIGRSKMNVVCNYLTWYSDGYDDGSEVGFKVLVGLDKMNLEVTVCSMDDTLVNLESILGIPGTNPSNGCPEFKYKFSSSEENGDLNSMLDKIKGILSSNNLKESDLTRIVRRIINETTESQTDIDDSSDLPRWLKRKRYGEDYKSVEYKPTDSPETWRRKLFLKDGTESDLRYDIIKYGYNNLNQKSVFVKNFSPDNNVEVLCDKKTVTSGERVNTSTIYYKDLNKSKQDRSDIEWLFDYCERIPKRSLVKTKDDRKLSMNQYIK